MTTPLTSSKLWVNNEITTYQSKQKLSSVCNIARTIARLVITGVSILFSPVAFVLGFIVAFVISSISFIGSVLSYLIYGRKPSELLEHPITSQPEAEEAKEKSLKVNTLAEHLNARHVRNLQLYESGVFKTLERVPFTKELFQEIPIKLNRILMSVHELINRVAQGAPIATADELESLSHTPPQITGPLSALIFGFSKILADPLSGTAWLCQALLSPQSLLPLIQCIKSLSRLTDSESISSSSPIPQKENSLFMLVNSFLYGWALSTEAKFVTLLQGISYLQISKVERNDLVNHLLTGNLLGMIAKAYRYQNLNWTPRGTAFLENDHVLWDPSSYREGSSAQRDDICLNKVAHAVHILSLENQSSEFKRLLKDIWNHHSSYISSCSGFLSVIIVALKELHKDSTLQSNLKNRFSADAVKGAEQFLSHLLLGLLATGICSEEHLQELSQELDCPPSVVRTMIEEQILVPTLLEKMLS